MPVSTLEPILTAIQQRKGIEHAVATALISEINQLRLAGQTEDQIVTALLSTYGASLALLDNKHGLMNVDVSLGSIGELLSTTFKLARCRA